MNDIQDIKEKVGQSARDIIIRELNLEVIGGKCRCPDKYRHRHGDKTPSMSWDAKQFQFKCFGCGKLLDIYSLYRDYLNYSHNEILRELLWNENYEDTRIAKNRAKFQDNAKGLTQLNEEQIDYLKSRKLKTDTIKAFKLQNFQGAIAFPYYQNEILIGCKTRQPRKHVEGAKYKSIIGSKPGLFNYDNIDLKQDLIICEGELDCMIIYQAGFHNVVSVGAGANSLTELIEQYKDFFESFQSLILFSDNDEAGSNMDETFLNIYASKTKLIDKSIMENKDANEEYIDGGAAAINILIESAKEKIEGFYNPDIDDVSLEELFSRGSFIPTGLPSVDKALNDLAPGCVTLVAGRANGGKSTFINQIVANAIEKKNKVFLVSGEDDKRILINRIYKAIIGRNPQLYDLVQINKRKFKIPKKSVLANIKAWHHEKLHLYMKGEGNLKTIDQLFELISRKIKLEKYNLVVIDNLMSVLSVKSVSDKYEVQADFVQRCCDISKLYHCHIIIVLHPNKTFHKSEQMDFEQISGSSDMSNKADNILAIIREYREDYRIIGIDGYCEILKNRYYPDLVNVALHYDNDTGLLLEYNEDTGRSTIYRFDRLAKS